MSEIQETCVVGTPDDDAAEDAEDEADEERDTEELELEEAGVDDEIETRVLEVVTEAEDGVVVEDREIELVTFVLIELIATALAELERTKETEELVGADLEADDDTDVDAGIVEEGATMVPLTFLGIENAVPSFVDRYRATLFH